MENNRKKYAGREFLRRSTNQCENKEEFNAVVEDFRGASLEYRAEVATGLIAIGADETETGFDRSFALAILATLIRTCGLRGDCEIEEQLTSIINRSSHQALIDPTDKNQLESNNQREQVQTGALLALIAVNRISGLDTLNRLISQHHGSEFGTQLQRLASTFNR
jgi:hypothetical protein